MISSFLYIGATSMCGKSLPILFEKSKSKPIIAITGADITLSILFGSKDSLSLSF